MENLTFITGGARSGKSILAEQFAADSQHPVYYVATMEKWDHDEEQVQRIDLHRKRRPANWTTIEAPYNAEKEIDKMPGPAFLVFDCLTLYITNTFLEKSDSSDADERCFALVDNLLDTIQTKSSIEFVIVSNEVGFGIVPENKLARKFRDILGLANQKVARAAERVFLTCSGIPLKLK